MFNRFKKALEDFVENNLQEVIEKTTDAQVSEKSAAAALPNRNYDNLPSIEDEPFERASKAEPVYPRITSFSFDDIPKLVESLDDPDPEQQVHAIQMAHELMKQSPESAPRFTNALLDVLQNDPDAPARAAAAEALNVTQFPKNLSKSDPNDVEVRTYYERLCDILVQKVIEDEDLLTQQNAAETLALLGTDMYITRAFRNIWSKQQGELDPFIRVAASIHIGKNYLPKLSGDKRKQMEDAILQAYVDYPEMEGVIRGVITFSKVDRAVPYLLKTFLNSENLDIRARRDLRGAIVTALGHIGSPKCLQPLLILMQNDKTIRGKTIDAIGKLENPEAIAPLKAFKASLPEKDPLHATIERALIKCGDIPDMSDLLEALQSDVVHKQSDAIQALSKIGSEEAIDALIDFLQTASNDNLRGETRVALTAHPSEKVAHAMIDCVCDGRLSYRVVVQDFRGKMKMSQAVKWLDAAVDERATPQAKVKIEQDRNFFKNF